MGSNTISFSNRYKGVNMKLLAFILLMSVVFFMFPLKVLAALILISAGILSLGILVFVLIACLLAS